MAALCDAISSCVRALRAALTSARVVFLRAVSAGSSSAAVDMDAETRGLRDELPKGAQRARAVGRRLVGLAWGDETTAKARNSLAAWSIRSWRAAGGRSATGRVERRNDRVMSNNALERSKSTFWLEPIPGLEATFFPLASHRAPVV